MDTKLKYSVLRYSPSMVAGESINLGVLFSDQTGEFREFNYTMRWNRVKEFDDELDIDMLKIILKSIKDEVRVSIYNYKKFNIEKFTSYYSNEYRFDTPIEIFCSDIYDSVDEITKMYLRYDFEKKQRPSREQEIAFISKIFKSRNIKYTRNAGCAGSFNDKVIYDYFFLDYGVKIFHLKRDSLSKSMNDIKAWAWNCQKNQNIKTMIFYEYDPQGGNDDAGTLQAMINILKDATDEVYILEEGIAQLNRLIERRVNI